MKNEILDAWLVEEQLDEGAINARSSEFPIAVKGKTYKEYFLNDIKVLEKNKELKKSGIVIYFDIVNSKKFSFCLCFDRDLNLLEDKTFYTMSGYMKKFGKIPKDLYQFEKEFKKECAEIFKNGFEEGILNLLRTREAKNLRYGYLKDVDEGSVKLHSFFSKDLLEAKNIIDKNLSKYVEGKNPEQIEIDEGELGKYLIPLEESRGSFVLKNTGGLDGIGKFNLKKIRKNNSILSINTPNPNYGIELLKEVFADNMVAQANSMLDIDKTGIELERKPYFGDASISVLPKYIIRNNMNIVCSNHEEVVKILGEFCEISKVYEKYRAELMNVDYFTKFANNKGLQRWGYIAIETGSQRCLNKITYILRQICEELKGVEEVSLYDKAFEKKYIEVEQEINNRQIQVENIKELEVRKAELKRLPEEHRRLIEQAKIDSENLKKEKEKEIKKIELVINKLKIKKSEIKKGLNEAENEYEYGIEYFEDLEDEKPRLFWLKKIVAKEEARAYLEEVEKKNFVLDKINEKIESKEIELKTIKEQIKEKKRFIKQIKFGIENVEKHLQIYIQEKEQEKISLIEYIDYLEDRINKFEELPEKEFTELKKELFILSLKVRKQFIIKNKSSLKAALNIITRQDEYSSELIKIAWDWISILTPISGTTFNSISYMYRNFDTKCIPNLIIYQAGNLKARCGVGSIYRSERSVLIQDELGIEENCIKQHMDGASEYIFKKH